MGLVRKVVGVNDVQSGYTAKLRIEVTDHSGHFLELVTCRKDCFAKALRKPVEEKRCTFVPNH